MKFDFNKKEYDYFIENCGFTDQEIEVLNYLRRGWTQLQIACEIYCSEKTVRNRVSNIKKKIIKCF